MEQVEKELGEEFIDQINNVLRAFPEGISVQELHQKFRYRIVTYMPR